MGVNFFSGKKTLPGEGEGGSKGEMVRDKKNRKSVRLVVVVDKGLKSKSQISPISLKGDLNEALN